MLNSLKYIICFLSLIVLSACLNTMEEQDHAFVATIKQHLKKKGDMVKVADIYPGNWDKVCFASGGVATEDALVAVSEFSGVNKKDLVVINRNRSDTEYVVDFNWGIYFFYPPNSVEYFNIYKGVLMPNKLGADSDDYSCVVNKNAFFVAMSNPKKNEKSKNFIYIQVTRKQEENIK